MTRNQKFATGAAIVVAGLLAAWAGGLFHRDDPFVAEIKTLAAEPPSKDNRDAMRDLMRSKFEGVSPEQRREMFEQMAPIFIPLMAKRFEAEYDRFIGLSPEEQKKELDKRIDEMEKRGNAGQGPPNGQRPTAAQIDEFRKKMLDWTTPDQRAKFEDGIRMLNDRRQQRGLAPVERPG